MQQHGMGRRRNRDHIGFARLWRGTPQWGTIRVVDLGYVFEDRAGMGRARMRGNISLHDQCQQVIRGKAVSSVKQVLNVPALWSCFLVCSDVVDVQAHFHLMPISG
jgi:hypothetical protein